MIDVASDGAVDTRTDALEVAICAETSTTSMFMATFVEDTVSGGCFLVGGGGLPPLALFDRLPMKSLACRLYLCILPIAIVLY
jgi:hypothetical protein